MNFQVREQVHPLFGAFKASGQMPELWADKCGMAAVAAWEMTKTGPGMIWQRLIFTAREPDASVHDSPESCPGGLLLFFHHNTYNPGFKAVRGYC